MHFTLKVSFGQQYDYTITARPYSHAVGFVYKDVLELRATCYASLHAILDFLIQEIADDVCNHILDTPSNFLPGIVARVCRDDKVILETYYQNGNLDHIVKHYMVPMWYTRY